MDKPPRLFHSSPGTVYPTFDALTIQMRVEEGRDAATRIHCGRFVVGKAGDAQNLENEAVVVVHEGMARIGVFLYVVGDECAL